MLGRPNKILEIIALKQKKGIIVEYYTQDIICKACLTQSKISYYTQTKKVDNNLNFTPKS